MATIAVVSLELGSHPSLRAISLKCCQGLDPAGHVISLPRGMLAMDLIGLGG